LTKYEVLRGWKAQRANRLLTLLQSFCQQSSILPISDSIIDRAAELWADLRRAGQPMGDSDPIIAATALNYGFALATRNVAHFSRIPKLTIEDWTRP
jgi:tRNA(fMet)-specific endonuclease VapC